MNNKILRRIKEGFFFSRGDNFSVSLHPWSFHVSVWLLSFEIGYYSGEDMSGLLGIEFMRWLWFPTINSLNFTLLSISVFKFTASLSYNA